MKWFGLDIPLRTYIEVVGGKTKRLRTRWMPYSRQKYPSIEYTYIPSLWTGGNLPEYDLDDEQFIVQTTFHNIYLVEGHNITTPDGLTSHKSAYIYKVKDDKSKERYGNDLFGLLSPNEAVLQWAYIRDLVPQRYDL